ncbi:MAG: TCP-1/cpn60 chaperonin family protein [Clostridia bacterium]
MSVKDATNTTELDEKIAALMTNMRAVKAVSSAVEGTIGPKGLDTMLVDGYGDVVITNAGVTILERMDVTHPAAKMMINIAKSQQEEIGDGTTTATIMAGSLISEGVEQVAKGVPVARIIEGIGLGIQEALNVLESCSIPLDDFDNEILKKIAYIAGREHQDIADLIVEAANMIGIEKFKDQNFKFSDTVVAQAGAENEVFRGVLINKKRLNRQMPEKLKDVKVLLIDDELKPEQLSEEALATETGFQRFMELKNQFVNNLKKIQELGINLVLVDKGVEDFAEEFLTDSGIIVCSRVSKKDMRIVADHTNARVIKRTGLNKSLDELKDSLGYAEEIFEDSKLKKMRLINGSGKSMATVLVGAATIEVVAERERIAKDAASAVQATIKGGYVVGGGSVELAISREVEKARERLKGMASYGLDCVVKALRKPVFQIILNAGFNPLEKIEDIIAKQIETEKFTYAIDCDTGECVDMIDKGVIDPYLVKYHAIKAAGEIAISILRIDTIIRMKKNQENPDLNNG